jgi:hypothetical protein
MNADSPRNGSTRVEREILEILERADAAATPVDDFQAAVRRRRASARQRLSRVAMPALSPQLLKIGGALLLAAVAAAISDLSRLPATLLAIASIVVFFSLWVPSRASGIGDTPRWRGQDVRDPGRPPSIDVDRLRSWWNQRKPNP